MKKRKILSWLHQGEIINKRMTQYLSEIHCSTIAAVTILIEKCPKQNEQLQLVLCQDFGQIKLRFFAFYIPRHMLCFWN